MVFFRCLREFQEPRNRPLFNSIVGRSCFIQIWKTRKKFLIIFWNLIQRYISTWLLQCVFVRKKG